MEVINKIRQQKWIVIFVIYLRYLLGGAMIFASIVKIQGNRFTSDDGSTSPINTALHMFETFYQSGLYWNFLGWSQFLVGAMLMTQLFATIGAIALLPITINIFVITLSYDFAYTPVITGLMLLANMFLVIWDYDKILYLLPINRTIRDKHNFYERQFESNQLWKYLGLVLFIVTIIFVFITGRSPFYWFLSCVSIGLFTLIHYLRKT